MDETGVNFARCGKKMLARVRIRPHHARLLGRPPNIEQQVAVETVVPTELHPVWTPRLERAPAAEGMESPARSVRVIDKPAATIETGTLRTVSDS